MKDLIAADGGWIASGVQQPGLTQGSGPGLAADQVPLGGVVVGLSEGGAAQRWRFAEPALSSASAVAVVGDEIWVVGHARAPLADALPRGPRGPSAAVVFALGRGGDLNRVVRVCDGVAVDQGHALALAPGGESMWWAGAVSADADCLPGAPAQAGVVFRASTALP